MTAWRLHVALGSALLLGACATESLKATGHSALIAVSPVPSDREEDCGPSAIATVLRAAGFPVSLEEARTAVHDERREGAPVSALVRVARSR